MEVSKEDLDGFKEELRQVRRARNFFLYLQRDCEPLLTTATQVFKDTWLFKVCAALPHPETCTFVACRAVIVHCISHRWFRVHGASP